MPLAEELAGAAARAATHAAPGEDLAAVLVAEPSAGRRVYLCAFAPRDENGGRTWLGLDPAGAPVDDRSLIREAVSIAALCELAAETAGGGDLPALRAHLLELRMREHPPGIEAAEEAALELERTVGGEPRLATPAYLDDVGAATRRLEQTLGEDGGSPFAAAMRSGMAAVDDLAREVEQGYKIPLN